MGMPDDYCELHAHTNLSFLDGATHPEELIAHPQLAARNRWRDVVSPVGSLRALLPPPVSDGWDLRMDAIPDVGQDTRAVLATLGRSAGQIDRLIADGIVSEPPPPALPTYARQTDSEQHADR